MYIKTMTDDTCTRASKMMEFHRQHGLWFLSTDSEAWWKISKIPSTKVFRTQTDSSKYCTREFMLPKPNHDSIHATVHNYNFHGSSTLPDSTSPEIRPGLKGSLNSCFPWYGLIKKNPEILGSRVWSWSWKSEKNIHDLLRFSNLWGILWPKDFSELQPNEKPSLRRVTGLPVASQEMKWKKSWKN